MRKKQLSRILFGTSSLIGVLMAFSAQASAANFNPADTSVQMFRWRWNDIAKECTNWLGPQGYGAVQVSPPHASRSLGTWYDVYQPVNYTKLDSLMGTEAEFQAMITTCHAAKVRVYADAVVNQMALASGTASDKSSKWDAGTLSYPNFSAADFHASCAIGSADYNLADRTKVMTCRLNDMPDLKTDSTYVQGQIRNYLNKLVGMGIDGVRLDAAKHMAPNDIAGFLNGASRTTTSGEPLWFTQEVLVDGGVKVADYFVNGTVNEFHYVYAMKEMFRNVNGASVSQLRSIMGSPTGWGGSWGFIPSEKATVFINNWDSERGDGNPSSLVASNFTGVTNDTSGSKRYSLANILMLAWPYGSAQIHSGFRFTNKDQGPPTASPFDASGAALVNQQWDFIHRWPEISNMVGFRAATSGQGVGNYATGTVNQLAFSRGDKGFVAINNDTALWNATLATGLPPGTYCNVVNGQLNAARTGCTGDAVVVPANGLVTLKLGSVTGTAVPAVALHANQKIAAAACTTVSVNFRVTNASTVSGQSVYVTGNRSELGNWTAASGGQLTIEGSGANAAWSRTIALPPSTAIQYKFLKHGSGADAWEGNQGTSSGNREAVTPACGAAALTLDAGSFKA